MRENEKYSCTICANAGTPICENCQTIESPSGKIRRPTRFVDSESPNKRSKRAVMLANIIQSSLASGSCVPLRYVMEYNRIVTEYQK